MTADVPRRAGCSAHAEVDSVMRAARDDPSCRRRSAAHRAPPRNYRAAAQPIHEVGDEPADVGGSRSDQIVEPSRAPWNWPTFARGEMRTSRCAVWQNGSSALQPNWEERRTECRDRLGDVDALDLHCAFWKESPSAVAAAIAGALLENLLGDHFGLFLIEREMLRESARVSWRSRYLVGSLPPRK